MLSWRQRRANDGPGKAWGYSWWSSFARGANGNDGRGGDRRQPGFGEWVDEPEREEDLLQRLADGDAAAIDVLYDEHAHAVFALLVRIVADRPIAEDLLQDVFVRAWRHADSYDRERGRVRPWLLGIAHHLALNELRRQRRRPRLEPPADGTPEQSWDAALRAGGPEPDEAVWATMRHTEALRALEDLPPQQREPIELYVSGYSQREIAERLGEPLGTIKSRLRRGLHLLRETLVARGFDGA